MNRRSMHSVLRLVLALLTLVAIGVQLIVQVQVGASVVNFFSYFTNLSNLFAAMVLLLGVGLWRPREVHRGARLETQLTGRRELTRGDAFAPSDQIRAMSVVNMAVVGIVFTVLLRNVDLGALRPWVNFVLHDLMPCAVVLDWLLQPPAVRLGLKHLLLCLIFPALYLVYVLIRGAEVGWYPYPFLNPTLVGGYGGVAAYAVGIAVTFLATGGLLLALGNRLGRNAA